MTNKKRLDATGVAAILKVSPQRVRQLAAEGRLRGRQVEARGQLVWEFTPAAVDRFLELDRQPGRPKAAALAS